MKTNIRQLALELKSYIASDKAAILQIRVNERLDKSLKQYYDDLSKTLEKLYIYDNEHENKLITKL